MFTYILISQYQNTRAERQAEHTLSLPEPWSTVCCQHRSGAAPRQQARARDSRSPNPTAGYVCFSSADLKHKHTHTHAHVKQWLWKHGGWRYFYCFFNKKQTAIL